MSLTAARVAAVGSSTRQAMGAYHPWGTGSTPMVMPLQRVIVTQAGLAYDTVQPIYTAEPGGSPLPATAPGSWGQLYAASNSGG